MGIKPHFWFGLQQTPCRKPSEQPVTDLQTGCSGQVGLKDDGLFTWGLIHRQCRKTYLMVCLRTIATQKFTYPEMIMTCLK